MRIAQVAPLYEACPPKLYGGTERVVAYLTDELVKLGHEVTLFASGDSVTSARLVPCCDQALRLDEGVKDPLVYHLRMIDRVRRRADEFDLIHLHTDYLHFAQFADIWDKTLTTQHGRLDLPDLPVIFGEFPMMPLSSISMSQRTPIGWANWAGNVLHGLPVGLHQAGAGEGGYLAFLGRFSPEKGPDRAIEIARRSGIPLQMAAKIDDVDRKYFDRYIAPALRDPMIEYIGEIGEADKSAFLGDAAALLFPINWPEPFGMVLIEAMAAGTPVVAYGHGSVPEIIEDGVTGFIVADMDEAVAAIARLHTLDRAVIRREFERRFSAERMARDYVALYEGQLSGAANAVAKAIPTTASDPTAEIAPEAAD